MRIKESNRAGPVGGKKGAGKAAAADGRFAGLLSAEDATASSGGPAPLAQSGALGSLLSLQEVDDPAARRSRGRQRAETILARLDDLRMALLAGEVPADQLRHIARAVQRERETVDDPALAGILDEIDLRAQVEMAKYGVDPIT